jgi:hypothetical protein
MFRSRALLLAAGVAGVRDDRGAIVPGQRAGLVLVDGDPTRDIGDIRKVALVVKGAEAYTPAAIHAEFGVQPLARGSAGGVTVPVEGEAASVSGR